MQIQHTAFLDLERGLTRRSKQTWHALWSRIEPELKHALESKQWGHAAKLIGEISTDGVVVEQAQYAQTIGLSSLILGASRLTTLSRQLHATKVVKDPPMRQLKNGVVQWGYQVSRNTTRMLQKKLLVQLAALEHKTEQARHVFSKYDENEARDKHGEWTTGALTEDQRESAAEAIEAYSEDYMYRPVNAALRAGKTADPTVPGSKETIAGLDMAFHSRIAATVKEAETVYRGVTVPSTSELGKDLIAGTIKVGSTIRDAAFMSTSTKEAISHRFGGVSTDTKWAGATFTISVPAGVHYLRSGFGDEQEQLMDRNSGIVVTSIEQPDKTKQAYRISGTYLPPSVSKADVYWLPPETVDHAYRLQKADAALADASVEDLLSDPDIQDMLQNAIDSGDVSLSLASSLMVSRLTSFGFLQEAQDQELEQYEISAILDEHTCPICQAMDGQVFSVSDGISHAEAIMNADDPDSLASIAPWPSQSKDSVKEVEDADAQDLVDMGLALPPYHGSCRCIAIPAESDSAETSDTADQVEELAQDAEDTVSTDDILTAIGIATGVAVADPFADEGEDEETEDATEEDDETPDNEPEETETDDAYAGALTPLSVLFDPKKKKPQPDDHGDQ